MALARVKSVGRNPKDGGKKKGDLKVHVFIDALQDLDKLVKATTAKVHDSKFVNNLTLKPFRMVVFDKVYIPYKLFARFTENKIWFITRLTVEPIYYHHSPIYYDLFLQKKHTGKDNFDPITILFNYLLKTLNIPKIRLLVIALSQVQVKKRGATENP